MFYYVVIHYLFLHQPPQDKKYINKHWSAYNYIIESYKPFIKCSYTTY